MSAKGERATYQQAAELTHILVGRFTAARGAGPLPQFAMTDPEVGIVAGIEHVGKYLARNEAAHDLLTFIMAEFDRADIRYPTLMMLRASLEMHGIPITFAPLQKLGLPREFLIGEDVDDYDRLRERFAPTAGEQTDAAITVQNAAAALKHVLGATYTLTLAWVDDTVLVGAYAPNREVMTDLLRKALYGFERAEADVVELHKDPPS